MTKYIFILKHEFEIKIFPLLLPKYTNNLFSVLKNKHIKIDEKMKYFIILCNTKKTNDLLH